MAAASGQHKTCDNKTCAHGRSGPHIASCDAPTFSRDASHLSWLVVCSPGVRRRWRTVGGSRNNIRRRSSFAPREGGQPSTSASPVSVLAVQLQTKQRRKTSASRAITIEPRSPTSPYEVYSSRTKLPSEKYPGLIYVRLGLLGWAIDRGGATQWCVQAWVAGGQGSDGWGLIFELDVDFGAGDGSLGAVRGA